MIARDTVCDISAYNINVYILLQYKKIILKYIKLNKIIISCHMINKIKLIANEDVIIQKI